MSNTLVQCPFHLERIGKTDGDDPLRWSCNVDLEQQVFFCHGCQAKGRLAKYPRLRQQAIDVQEKGGGYVPRKITEFYIPPLEGSPLEYLLSRGFTKNTLETFGVGGNQNTVVIPVKLRSGKIVGTISRSIGEHDYRYSAGFKKRNHLYGSHVFVPDEDLVVIVEGALDCMRLYQLGLKNTIAFLGVNPHVGQLSLLSQLGSRILLAFDNDEAGWEATKKVGGQLQELGHNVSVLIYNSSDPGDLPTLEKIEVISLLKYLLNKSHVLNYCVI